MTKLINFLERAPMDKSKALETALSQIERNFGKGSIMKLGQDNPVIDIESISTGSISLDIALGIGGLPKGRIIEIYGPESSGKTTLALHVVAEEQKKEGICAFVDARVFMVYGDCPCLVYGPYSENIHGFDERVSLSSVKRITKTIALFIADWCKLEEI